MRASLRCFVLACGLVAQAAGLTEKVEMPVWDAQEGKLLEELGWLPGADLLPEKVPSTEVSDDELAPFTAEPPTADDLPTAPVVPAIAETALTAYFAERPSGFLVDPQALLEPELKESLTSRLARHTRESSIDLVVYVFGKDQEIPGEMREEEVIERLFMTGRPAVLVYYFLGQPQQTAMYLSPSITDPVSAAEQRRVLASAVMQAMEKSDAGQQLTAFVGQLGVQIYGMEDLLGGPSASAEVLPPIGRPVSAKATKKPSRMAAIAAQCQATVIAYWLPGGLVIVSLIALGGIGWWWCQRASYSLPEFEVEPRLGGDHAAGIGAVISFTSSTMPPASQRTQIPEYLHYSRGKRKFRKRRERGKDGSLMACR